MGSGANMKDYDTICCYTITGIVNKMLASIKINKKSLMINVKCEICNKLNDVTNALRPNLLILNQKKHFLSFLNGPNEHSYVMYDLPGQGLP